jgi:DNA replication protein DnaC
MKRTKSPATEATNPATPALKLRERILGHLETLRIVLPAEQLDVAVAQAEKERWGYLEFLQRLLGEQADLRRQRAVERRIRDARFHEPKTLAVFDWKFNARTIDRAQIEGLATGEFIRRGDNLVVVGQSGVGKSHLIQGVGRAA